MGGGLALAAVMIVPAILGYGLAALAIREVRMAVIGLPALLIAVALLARLWREAGEEARRLESTGQATGTRGR